MEKDQKALLTIIIIVFLIAFSICCFLIQRAKIIPKTDGSHFKKEYEKLNETKYLNYDGKYYESIPLKIPNDNIYVYRKANEIIKILKNKSGVILMGMACSPVCRNIVLPLMEVAQANDIKQIYYLDLENIRDTYEIVQSKAVLTRNGTKEYYQLLVILDSYLDFYQITAKDGTKLNTGEKRINAGTVIVVKNGKILNVNQIQEDNNVFTRPLSKKNIKQLKADYQTMFQKAKQVNQKPKKISKTK